MEKIKLKKERKFLKAVGNIAKVLANELVMGIARKFIGKAIDKVGNKRQGLVIAFLLVVVISYASIDSIPYPVTGNKQRLGWQTNGNGLVYRGRSNDTITKPSSYVDKNVKAYLLLDSVRGTIFVWRQTYWDSILVGGGAFAQPIDSLFFDTSVPTNNVETAKMRWDSDLATVVLGLNDNVPNELGFKNFWLVKNQTGSTITKGSIVYANGTVGASGRITVAKFIANGSIDAKYLLGITAHDLIDGEDGYVISFGKIRQVNTDTFAAGAILYPSPTVAGVWTDVEPVAPNIDMPIGFCINSSVNNGTIAIRVASGYKLSELHDVSISSPVEKSSLYYSGGLWRDTTAALLVSDTASMLTNYLRTGVAASTYLTQSNAASTYLPLAGGTLTGGLNGTTGTFTGLNVNNTTTQGILTLQGADNNTATRIDFKTGNEIRRQIIVPSAESNMQFRTSTIGGTQGGYSFYTRRNPNLSEFLAFNIDLDGNTNFYGTLGVTGATTLSSTLGVSGETKLLNKTFVGNGIDNTPTSGGNHNIRLESNDVSSIGFHDYLNTIGNIKFSGATGFVIGASDGLYGPHSTTIVGDAILSAPLTVNSSAVFNEGSTDSDFRVESDGNANMVFVDASTDRVGIGYASPTKTLDVNGEVRINTVTATPTSLLGKDGSNVVGNVRLTSPLSLAGDSLNLGTVPISKGGTGAESASVARTTLGVGYTFFSTTTGATIVFSSNRVSLVITGTGLTTTIDLSTATSGRQYMIKNLSNASVVSGASNVIPLAGGSPTNAILSAGNVTPQWVTLVADGTNWHVMQSN